MIHQFVHHLEYRLRDTLPGMEAQKLMMPQESTEARFNLDRKDVKRGGVLILFYLKNGEIYLPLTQRQDYEGTHGGQVSFPGGKWEDGDPDIEHTALRETYEEIGVKQSNIKVIGRLTDLYIPPSNFRVSPIVGYSDTQPDFKLDPFEVKELIEVPLSHLMKRATLKKKDILVRGRYRLEAPFFDVKGKVVWGATAMMLSELVTIVREVELDL